MKPHHQNREDWLTRLYLTVFPVVAQYIAKRGGTLEEAKDLFQDALVVYYEKVTAGSLQLSVNEGAYLMGIVKHLWYHKQQKQGKTVSAAMLNAAGLHDTEPLTPSVNRLLRYLETAGQKCMAILQAFYYEKQNMKQIAETFGLSGERSAAVQKHKCLEKVRNTVQQKALTYEDFCI